MKNPPKAFAQRSPVPSFCEGISGAAATGGFLREDAASDQVVQVAQRGVRRCLGEGRPLGVGELPVKSVEQEVQHLPLSFLELLPRLRLPETRLADYLGQHGIRPAHGAREAAQEPLQPRGEVEVALLGRLQHIVVGFALALDLRRHAVEPLRTALGAGQCQVRDGPRDPSVAVLERMDGDEPKMGDRRFDDRIDGQGALEPIQERPHLAVQPYGSGSFKVDLLFPVGSRHDLHRHGAPVPPSTHDDPAYPAAPRREQRGVPVEEPFGGQGADVVLGRIEHHLHDAFDMAVGRDDAADVDAQSSGDRGADLGTVEDLFRTMKSALASHLSQTGINALEDPVLDALLGNLPERLDLGFLCCQLRDHGSMASTMRVSGGSQSDSRILPWMLHVGQLR